MAIKFIAFVCDGCKKEAFGTGRKLPEGWQGLRWVEGLLTSSIPSGKYEFCSPSCVEKLMPRDSLLQG